MTGNKAIILLMLLILTGFSSAAWGAESTMGEGERNSSGKNLQNAEGVASENQESNDAEGEGNKSGQQKSESPLIPVDLSDEALETKENVEQQIGTIKELLGDSGEYTLFGASTTEYLLCFIFLLAGFTARALLLGIFGRIGGLAEKRDEEHIKVILDGAGPPVGWILVAVGLWFAVLVLPIDPVYYSIIHKIFIAGFIILGIWVFSRLIDILTDLWMKTAEKTESKLDDQIVPIIRSTTKVFVVLVGFVMVLQNVGVNVTGLFAGLGIGGMALALASQDFLTNLFGGVVIFLDRPFQIGDWIEVGDWEGTVEEVGLRTTRVRTFARSLITVPNAVFTKEKVNNWSRMGKRRIKTSVGLTYDTTPAQMEAAVEKIKQIILDDEKIRNDFFLVNFNNFGAHSLDIFIYCFTWTTKWDEFMDAQQNFFLEIMRGLEDLGLDIAFPTTTVHLAGNAEDSDKLKKVPD